MSSIRFAPSLGYVNRIQQTIPLKFAASLRMNLLNPDSSSSRPDRRFNLDGYEDRGVIEEYQWGKATWKIGSEEVARGTIDGGQDVGFRFVTNMPDDEINQILDSEG